mmetsp:Transcript_7592/g.12441  ORF Transcript_7592/g.12441 Transcript_7592/m.12441 type:complete len:105 (+) Transcript_7592:87-401(+)
MSLKYEETHARAAISAPDGSRNMHGCDLLVASKAAHASASRTKSCRRKADPMKDQSVHIPALGGKGQAELTIEPPAGVRGTRWSYEGAPLKSIPCENLDLDGVR